jgi:hypothetical protein
MTAEGGSEAGAVGAGGWPGADGAVLQAATNAAAALDTRATSQKRRGAAVGESCGESCLIVLILCICFNTEDFRKPLFCLFFFCPIAVYVSSRI